ncbi:MAG: YicC/YloC family endoribonuclease [Polyangiales bacterium]
MTGFGVGEASLGAGRVCIEARSVNHRFLEVRVRLPRELSDQSVFVEQLLRKKLSRGRVDVTVHWEGGHGGIALDRQRAHAAIRALRELSRELGSTEEVPLSLLASVPDLFVPAADVDRGALREALTAAAERCGDALTEMRAREGALLAAELTQRVETVRAHMQTLGEVTVDAGQRHRERVRERVQRIVQDSHGRVDGGRIEQELALLAEHADVSEELTRLGLHAEQFAALLALTEPVGRRLDFVLQEMCRESNTLGSKAIDAEVTRWVVELKAELERMREQVQNVE